MAPPSDVEATTRAFATRFLDESFADAAALLTEDGREAVVESFPEAFRDPEMTAADALEQYWRGLYSQYSVAEAVGEVRVDGDKATVTLAFENGTETATLRVDGDAITAVSFTPEYEPPAYADENAFSERDVTIDAGDVSLGGVLTVPDGDGPFPGVVLVHGAGVHDPDGTAGNTKLLKDLAWGLASAGIATLRYEKRLTDHEVPDEAYTLDRVVTDDAIAAVDELAAAADVDDDALFVAGHSQGGTAAPRIADRHGSVAGVINLDGTADSVFDPAHADIIRYEMDPEGDLDEEQEAALETERETAQRIAEGDFTDDETLWGQPGVWHRSLLQYDPTATASDLEAPVFVLKTCRADEESQPELVAFAHDDAGMWRGADLVTGSRVELYEGLDHYFQTGAAPSSPLGLYFGGNVDKGVVDDLVAWIQETAA